MNERYNCGHVPIQILHFLHVIMHLQLNKKSSSNVTMEEEFTVITDTFK